MNVEKWLQEISAGKDRKVMPIMTHPGIEMINRKVLDAVTDGNVHFESIKALNEKFPQSIACTSIMDLTVEAEAFGAPLCMYEDEIPTVKDRLLTSYEEVVALAVPGLDKCRVPEFLKVCSLAAAELDKPFLAGCIGPYSLASRLFGMTETMMGIYIEPDTIRLLLEKCTEFLLKYVSAMKETGIAGVIMAEPAAGLLSDDDCCNWSSVFVREVVKAVQDDTFTVILHNCGNTGQCTQAMVKTEARCLHFGNQIDMVQALENCPSDIIVMGNLDPVGVVQMCSPEEVGRLSLELLGKTRKYHNFVFSTGCDTPPQIPEDNIRAFYNAVEQYNS